jgi:Exostosin family
MRRIIAIAPTTTTTANRNNNKYNNSSNITGQIHDEDKDDAPPKVVVVVARRFRCCKQQQRFIRMSWWWCTRIVLIVVLVWRGIWMNRALITTTSNSSNSSKTWLHAAAIGTRITQLFYSSTRTIRIRSDYLHSTIYANNNNPFNNNNTSIKSCVYKRRRWHCQECRQVQPAVTGKQQQQHQQQKCVKLHPRGKCPPFAREGLVDVARFAAPARRWDDNDDASNMTSSSASISSFSTLFPLVPTRTLYHLNNRYRYEQQPLCTVATCFDLDRCRRCANDGGVLTVYVNTSTLAAATRNKQQRRDLQRSLELLEYAIDSINNSNNINNNSTSTSNNSNSKRSSASRRILRLERVEQHQDACLVVIMRGMYDSVQELKSCASWNHGGAAGSSGQNHFLWQVNRLGLHSSSSSSSSMPRMTADTPFSSWHVGLAAVADEALTMATWRPQYDISLPLARQWHRPQSPETVDIHRPRPWLLSFRGSIQNTRHVHYQHRWLAAEYWSTTTTATTANNMSNSNSDVWINVQCKTVHTWTSNQKVIAQPYDGDGDNKGNNQEYSDMMWNSTFGFAPGGSGAGSFRFGEILSTGGIPVLVQQHSDHHQSSWVPPLYPEETIVGSDWTRCIVFVEERYLIDLPRILRQMSVYEIRQRQEHCWRLFHGIIGDVTDEANGGDWREDVRVTFTRAMEIWALRIAHAMEMKKLY